MKNLGKRAKDKITGFEGVITAKCYYLTGCAQYGITPLAINGEVKETHYFDEGRVDLEPELAFLEDDVSSAAKGGPNRDAPRK